MKAKNLFELFSIERRFPSTTPPSVTTPRNTHQVSDGGADADERDAAQDELRVAAGAGESRVRADWNKRRLANSIIHHTTTPLGYGTLTHLCAFGDEGSGRNLCN